jgi:hypothetical protein
MPSYVLRQPNGLLAEFSTVVDNFTVLHATEEDMRARWRYKIGVEQGDAKVRRGLDDDTPGGWFKRTADDGLNRWRNAICTVRLVHGDKEADELERECSAPPSP